MEKLFEVVKTLGKTFQGGEKVLLEMGKIFAFDAAKPGERMETSDGDVHDPYVIIIMTQL